VQPVYVRSDQANAIPELRRVVVVNGGTIGIGDTLREALTDSLSGQVAPPEDGGEPPTGSIQQQIQVLLAEAAGHFEAADTALRNGDLATYQSEIDLAAEAVNQANELAAQIEGASPTPSVTPTPSPSA